MGEVYCFEYARQQKPNSKWGITLLTNVAFRVYPLVDRPIGRGKKGKLTKWLIENRGLDALEKDQRAGDLYAGNLCYFRCLARHQGCSLKTLERKIKELASRYFGTLENPESFTAVHLRDLHALDKLVNIHTFVYSLGEDQKVELVHRQTEKKEEFTATTYQWSPRHDTPENAAYANLDSSKWNGKEMGLWVSLVKLSAVGVRRATKPAAK